MPWSGSQLYTVTENTQVKTLITMTSLETGAMMEVEAVIIIILEYYEDFDRI